METELASETLCFFKKLDDGQVPKKKIVSVNFSCAMFSSFGFLDFEDGIEKLTQNIGKELPLYTTKYLRRAQISHDNLALQALVWLHVVQF